MLHAWSNRQLFPPLHAQNVFSSESASVFIEVIMQTFKGSGQGCDIITLLIVDTIQLEVESGFQYWVYGHLFCTLVTFTGHRPE